MSRCAPLVIIHSALCRPPSFSSPMPLRCYTGATLLLSPGGSRNSLPLLHLWRNFCYPASACGIVVPTRCFPALSRDIILLPRQPAPLAEARSALHLRPRRDASILLPVGQPRAVSPRRIAEPLAPAQLGRGARVLGFDIPTPVLFAADGVVHPVAAAATPGVGIKAFSGGRAEGGAAACRGLPALPCVTDPLPVFFRLPTRPGSCLRHGSVV